MAEQIYECNDCGYANILENMHQRSHPGMVDCPKCFGEVEAIGPPKKDDKKSK